VLFCANIQPKLNELQIKGYKGEMGILMDLSLGIDILSGLFWLPIILNHSQKNSICIVN